MGTHIIEFPGIGLGPFEIDPKAFSVFGIDIVWYGILVTLGIISGVAYAMWRSVKYNNIKLDDIMDITLFSIPAAIIGARLYYILFNLDKYKTFASIIATREGGLAVYGGIIFGLLTGFLVCKYKKISFMNVFDAVAPAIMLGQIIGRWGNFTNAEAYGGETDLPWRMSIQSIYASKPIEVHPTFLYEMLWNLVGFVIINLLYKKRKFTGQIFFMYITWYGFGRMFIEGLRTDSLYIGDIRVSQIVSLVCFIAGAIILIVKLRKSGEKEEYENVYDLGLNEDRETEDNSDSKE